MLPLRHRVRTSADFTDTVRSGARIGRRNLVLYAVGTSEQEPSRVGFIVSKGIGNAVTRNLVKRRLRAIAALSLPEHSEGVKVVVRALPASALATWPELSADYRSALASCLRRLNSGAASADSRVRGHGR